MKKLHELSKQENGYSLAGVLIIFIVATVLGLSIVALSVNSMNISNKEHDDQSAFYIAESGTTYRVAKVETLVKTVSDEYMEFLEDNPTFGVNPLNPGEIDEELIAQEFFDRLDEALNPGGTIYTETYNEFDVIKGQQPEAEITIKHEIMVDASENPRKYNIISTGEIGDESRTVNLPILIEFHEKPEYAILTKEGIEIIGKKIVGDIGTINPDAEVVVFPSGQPIFEGEIFVPNGDEDAVKIANNVNNIPMPPNALDEDTDIPNLPPFPERFPSHDYQPDIVGDWNGLNEIHLTESVSYQLISIPSGMTYTIDIGNTDLEIVVDSLNVNGNLKIIGSGKLTMYVRDKFHTGYEMGSSASIGTPEKINDINIYYKGDLIRLGGNAKIYSSLHAEKANLYFGAGAGFMGNILTDGTEISMQGGSDVASQLILAPNADVSHTNGTIKGMIVSKTYHASGGAELEFDQSLEVEGPLSLEEIMGHSVNAGNTFMQRPDPSSEKQSVREK